MTTGRFPLAALESADEQRFRALWGRPPINLYRILAHQPVILRAWTEWNNALRHGCTLDRALRELIFLRSAELQGSSYEWAQHLPMARAAGLPEEKIAAVAAWEGASVFDNLERTLLRVTDEITRGQLSDDGFARLRGVLSAAEAIEVIVTASHAAMLARVIQAIAVDLDSEAPADGASRGRPACA